MNWDEVWSVWQTFGTPADTLRWTPHDWPPLYFLIIGSWKDFAGFEPFTLRVSSLLVSMLGAAFTYRAAYRLGGERAALFTTLVYGALGFAIFLGLLVRAYSFLLTLSALALWLTLRYFEQPSIRRGLALAFCCVVMWFLHYTAVFVFLLLGVVTFFRYPRVVWRWWLPGGIVVVVGILSYISKRDVFLTRTVYNATIPLPSLSDALAQIYAEFGYPLGLIWVVLFAIATFAILTRPHVRWRVFGFLLWAGAPIVVYFLNDHLGLFQNTRYLWWAIIGIIFWVGLGLALLKTRILQIGAVAALTIIAIFPFQIDDFQASQYRTFAPVDYNFKLLGENMRPGDVILVDPNCGCAPDEAWDYYMRIYFPNGLPFVHSAEGHRRIWYASVNWLADPATLASVEQGRVAGKYFGPPNFLIRLYEAPPDPEGILYDNGMRFHGAEIERFNTPRGPVYHEGETVKVRFWWSADQRIPLDYSVSLVVYDAQEGIQQLDGPPHATPTSQWQPGQFYIEERDIPLPFPLDPSTYSLWMALYFWEDQRRLTAPGVDDRGLLKIGEVIVHSW